MATTSSNLPTVIVANGTGVNAWTDPTNILLVDGDFASTSDTTAELTVGTFNLNIPDDSTITNFTIRVKGYRGSFNTTLQIYAVDVSSGATLSYPMTPFQGFSGSNTTYALPSTLFGTTWTSDQANAMQLKLMVDGELHLDSIQLQATYVANVPVVPVTPSSGEIVVDEFVQGIEFQLAQSMTASDLFLLAESFTLPDGTEIQYADFHGEALITIDQGVPGSEENVRLTNIEHDYNGTGLTRLSFTTLNNRGLGFIYPYTTDASRRVNHIGTAKFVISNSAPFYDRFLRKNQINALVSAPIYVLDENVALADPAHELDFRGAGVNVVNDGTDTFKKIITIDGIGNSTPVPVATSSATTGAAQATSLTWSHTSSGINRLLVVQVDAEQARTVTGITFNGVALTQRVTTTNGVLRTEQWTLTAPAVGTYNIVVTMSGLSGITCGAETFVSVNQTAPTGATQTAIGTSLSPSQVLATTVDNSIVVDSLTTATLPIVYTVGAGQSENWKITANPTAVQGASSIEGAGSQPDNITMSWAITQSVAWAVTALEICGVPSPTGTGTVQSVTGLDTDNTDPANPLVQISVDGTSITGDGTPGNPLVANTSGGSAETVQKEITQTAHGFAIGDWVRSSGVDGEYTLSQSNTSANADVEGVVVAVPTVNTFTLVSEGWATLTSLPGGAVAGSTLWLSPTTAGEATVTQPTTVGQVQKPIGTVIDASTFEIKVNNMVGRIIPNTSGGGSSVTNINIFEDFINETIVGEAGTGTDTYGSYGGIFQSINGSGGAMTLLAPEANHPGILRFTNALNEFTGFATGSVSLSGNGNLLFTYDFDISVMARMTYDGVGTLVSEFQLLGGSNTITITLTDTAGVQDVDYDIGGGVVASGVTLPVSGAWFVIRFTMVSGTLTAYLDANVIYTGTPGFTDFFKLAINHTDAGG